MTTKKQRRRIKELAKSNLTTIKIAEKLGISENEVSGVFGGGKGYQKSRIRNYLGVGLVLVGIGVGAINYFLPSSIYRKENPKIEGIESLDVIRKFDRLPENEQNDVLLYLEQFVIQQTDIGRIAKYIDDKVKVPEVIDNTLPSGAYYYLSYGNVIRLKNPSNPELAGLYLRGSPFLLNKTHEKLHAIQDNSSSWDELENFFRNKNPYINEGSETPIKFNFTIEEIWDFVKKAHGNLNIQLNEAEEFFIKLVDKYRASSLERKLIREVQAYTTLMPISNEELYRRLQEKEYKGIFSGLSKDKFNEVFSRTLELSALLEPIEAAKFVGQNGNFISEYVEKVEKLKRQKGIQDALGRGINRQLKLVAEVAAIQNEARRYINEKYSKYKLPTQTPNPPSQ